MEQNKKEFRIICDYETFLRESIDWYNSIYKTDFVLFKYIHDEVNFAIIEYKNATESQVFDLGKTYGRKSEAYDKKISNPRSSFED
jgi:hypothetical protein